MQRDNQIKVPTFLSNFISNLVQLLNETQNQAIVRWMPNGIGFEIIKLSEFQHTILPKYYRHSKIASFVRQLNMYGFHKLKQNERNYYHHQYFNKQCPDLLCNISRKPQKKLQLQQVHVSDKQNEVKSIKQHKQKIRKSKKKVSFEQNIGRSDSMRKLSTLNFNEIMSDVSIKYQCENNMNSSHILGQYNHQENINILISNADDDISVYAHISDKPDKSQYSIPRADQFLGSTHKVIFWGASQIIQDED